MSETEKIYTGRSAEQIENEYGRVDVTLTAGDVSWEPRMVCEVNEVRRADEGPSTFLLGHHPSANALSAYFRGLAPASESEVVVIEGIATSNFAGGPYARFQSAYDRGETVEVEGDAPEGEYRAVSLEEFDSYKLYVKNADYDGGYSEREYNLENGFNFRLTLSPLEEE